MAGPTLEELENDVWGEPDFPSHLVTTCHRLRKKPIDEFTAGELRMMLGQSIGVRHLLPRAIKVLQKDVLALGEFYEGDLLFALTKCKLDEVDDASAVRKEIVELCKQALAKMRRRIAEEFYAALEKHSMDDFGLTREAAKDQIDARIAKISRSSPWSDFKEFVAAYG